MGAAIKDVAREAGLSISTISKYLNGGKVKSKNQAKIEEAIRKLNYRPNEFARGLRTSKSYIIGIIIYRLRDIFSGKLAGNIEFYLREKGYSIILWSHEGVKSQAEEALEFMLKNQVEGLIVEPIPGQEHLYERVLGKIPVVSVDGSPDMQKFDSVMSNSMLGVYQGTEYLIEKGHKKIGMISAGLHETEKMPSGVERWKGFQRAMEDYGLKINQNWVAQGDFTFQSGYEGMKKIWESPEHPTAVIAVNYNMCMGMMKALHEMKVRVPEELSVLSMDDMVFSTICTPKLTAIRQPVEEIAQKAVELLLKRISGNYSDFPKTLKIHTIFVERESVIERKNENLIYHERSNEV